MLTCELHTCCVYKVVKGSPFTRHEGALWRGVVAPEFLPSALYENKSSDLRPRRFIPREGASPYALNSKLGGLQL
jgi:hypothetical protein